MGLFVEETWVDRNRNCQLGSSDVYETWCSTSGELYKEMQRLYGRCISKMYIDKKDGTSQWIGWVFLKKEKYEDCNEYFLRETWVSVHESPVTVTRTVHYADLSAKKE